MYFQKPNVFIIHKKDDVNSLLVGTFWLKGFEPFKFSDGKECLKRFRELDGKIDAVVTSHEIAFDNDLKLIVTMKRINPNTKVLVIADEDSDKTRILGYGADEFTLKPMSLENVSDKVLMLLSREAVMENR